VADHSHNSKKFRQNSDVQQREFSLLPYAVFSAKLNGAKADKHSDYSCEVLFCFDNTLFTLLSRFEIGKILQYNAKHG